MVSAYCWCGARAKLLVKREGSLSFALVAPLLIHSAPLGPPHRLILFVLFVGGRNSTNEAQPLSIFLFFFF